MMDYFIARYGLPAPSGAPGFNIGGRFEIRQRIPSDVSRSWFGPPERFLFDSGAVHSVVDKSFALRNGFDDGLGWDALERRPPLVVRGLSGTCRSVVVLRRVRFRDYKARRRPGRRSSEGGIERYEFDLTFAVLLDHTLALPLLGLVEAHRYFALGDRDDEYVFWMRDGIEDRDPGVHSLTSSTSPTP